MDGLDKSFVEKVIEPVRVVDSLTPPLNIAQQPATLRTHQFSTLDELTDFFHNVDNSDYRSRLISICQRNSWRPLQITRPMLGRIASEYDSDPAFWELPSCFYTRTVASEEVFSIPFTQRTRGTRIEISYTIRYPEFKPDDGNWAIRQSGIYHSMDTKTSRSVFVLFNPVPNSELHQRAEQYLASLSAEDNLSPFWLHELLFTTYFPAWRRYIASQEQVFLPISGTTFSTYIDKPLRLGYDQLSVLVSLQNRFLQMPAMLAHGAEVLGELSWLINEDARIPKGDVTGQLVAQFRNLQRQCLAYSRNAGYLQQRIQATATLLSDTLSFRDQVVAKEQNGTMLQLNKSAVFITMLTLLYLPASFVATFFGMNFFDMNEESGTIVGSSMIWIFVIVTVGLTAATFLSYYWLLKHDGRLFSKVAPTVHLRDWKHLTRRFTLRDTPGADEKSLPI